jgi:Zn-dependent protease with chaperone function
MLTVALWLVCALGALASLLFTALVLALSGSELGADLAAALRLCAEAFHHAILTHDGSAASLLGAALLLSIGLGLVAGGTVTLVKAVRASVRHRDILTIASTHDERIPGVRVLEHPMAFAYCLPGGTESVVVTTGALERLSDSELAAVVLHERAHQRGRHHLIMLTARALRAGFPWLPAARLGRGAIQRAIELSADDRAARLLGRIEVARALARLGIGPLPHGGLAATGLAVSERIRRLTMPPRGGFVPLSISLLAVTLPLLLPFASVVDPVSHLAGFHACVLH